MPGGKKTPELRFLERIQRIQKAGLKGSEALRISENEIPLQKLKHRLDKILEIIKSFKKSKISEMLCFIMYDIEDDKIRTHIAKYLIRKGCQRVQKSVYLAKTKRKMYSEMHTTLKEVQKMYDNDDSIFFLPVGEDNLNSMKVIGKNVDFELVIENKNTIFI